MRRWILWLFVPAAALLYGSSYAIVRATHRLVRTSSGCVSKPDLNGEWRSLSCADLRLIDSVQGRSVWQSGFAPCVGLEEWLRPGDRVASELAGSRASGVGRFYRTDDGKCWFVPSLCKDGQRDCGNDIIFVACPEP